MGQASGEVNICPWSKLNGEGQCQLRAGRLFEPSHLNPRDLISHLARDHGSGLAQHAQAEAMVRGVMPHERAGPFAATGAGLVTPARPSGVLQQGAQTTSSPSASTSAVGSTRPPSLGGKGCGPAPGRGAVASRQPSGATGTGGPDPAVLL